MNYKWLCLLVVICFFVFSNCKEGYDSFHINEFEHIDGSKQDDGFKHVDEKQEGHPSLINVYGESLQSCRREGSDDKRGSWMDGYCSEKGGGVHQICLDVDKTDDFSENTGQGDWSKKRQGKNHCMCLGAWALYKAKQEKGIIPKTDDELHCESIMKDALHERYVGKWNTWNGHELDDQIVHGVNQLMEQCHTKGNLTQKKHIKQLYKDLTDSRPEFHNTDTYKKHS